MKRDLTILACLTLVSGCATNQGDFSWITHTWTTDRGVYAMDHVSGKLVDTASAIKHPYLGETYYFENEEHARMFDSNPFAYLYNDNVWLQGKPGRTDQN
jgi:YHS domain-containing protein